MTYPGAEAVVLGLLVSADVVVRVAAVPAELVLLVAGDVHILEVAVRLLSVAAAAVAALGRDGHGQHGQTEQGELWTKTGEGSENGVSEM